MDYLYLTAFLIALIFLYNISVACHYYLRIIFFCLCIFLHGIECNLLMISSWLQGKGADLIFHIFRYWCLWTGVNVEVRGFNEHLANMNQPVVVVANHQSIIDVIAMCYVWPPRGIVMMKKSLMYIPFFNIASYLANTVFVDRFNHKKAMIVVDQCVEHIKTKNLKLWIFPEGTRNHNDGLLPFKKGAFNIAVRAQIPIVPIVISHYRPFYSKINRYFRTDGEIIIQVLPPVKTEGLSLGDVCDLTERIRDQMLPVYINISEDARKKMEKKRPKLL